MRLRNLLASLIIALLCVCLHMDGARALIAVAARRRKRLPAAKYHLREAAFLRLVTELLFSVMLSLCSVLGWRILVLQPCLQTTLVYYGTVRTRHSWRLIHAPARVLFTLASNPLGGWCSVLCPACLRLPAFAIGRKKVEKCKE